MKIYSVHIRVHVPTIVKEVYVKKPVVYEHVDVHHISSSSGGHGGGQSGGYGGSSGGRYGGGNITILQYIIIIYIDFDLN